MPRLLAAPKWRFANISGLVVAASSKVASLSLSSCMILQMLLSDKSWIPGFPSQVARMGSMPTVGPAGWQQDPYWVYVGFGPPYLIYIDMLKVLSNSGTKSNGMEMAMGAKVRDSFPSLWLNRMFGGVNTDRYMKMGRRKLTTADTQFLAIVNLEDLLNSHAIAINYQTQYQWFFWYGNEVVLPRSSVCRWLQLLQALYQEQMNPLYLSFMGTEGPR